MRRYGISAFCLLMVMVLSSTLQAGGVKSKWHSFWHRAHTDFYRMNAYPEPFNTIDRHAYRKPFDIQIAKGWHRQNTLGQFYFHPETQQLNAAGQRKVFWILTQAPAEHRDIFVVTGMSKETAEARIDSVQTAAAKLLPGQGLPSITATFAEPQGWSADRIDTINQAWMQSHPAPRLPTQ